MTAAHSPRNVLRAGTSLPEMILAAWLFAFVLLGLARFATAQSRLVSRTADRARAEDAVRVTQLILDQELRFLGLGDIGAAGGDSIRVRALRGGGPVCPDDTGGVNELVVRYRGVRLPEPAKDSLLLVHARSARGTARDILAVAVAADSGCPDGLRLTLSGAVPPRGLALVFETGSYSLSAGALRYRRGAAGRQPLTETIMAVGDLDARGYGYLARIRFAEDSLPNMPPDTHSVRVHLLNRANP